MRAKTLSGQERADRNSSATCLQKGLSAQFNNIPLKKKSTTATLPIIGPFQTSLHTDSLPPLSEAAGNQFFYFLGRFILAELNK